MNFTSNPSPSKLKGQIMIVLEVYTLTEVFNLYTQSLSNLSSGVMHNHDLVQWEKNQTQFGHASWNDMGYKLDMSQVVISALDTHWVAHETTSQNR